MTSNFEFLKNIDKKLFSVVDEAEKLYRDGYFEQSAIQVRKFGEYVTKNILGVRRTTEETFDDMLATLKDILGENERDKEFIDDLYFIKKIGNLAAHDGAAPVDGNSALECLKRAFEVSINYAIKNNKANKKILNSHYNIDLLMTGKVYKFSEKYQEIKEADTEGIKEIVKRAYDKEEDELLTKEKVKEVDFKNKKIKKNKKSYYKTKKEKQTTKKQCEKSDTLLLSILSGVLFIFAVCILIFILPF